MKRPTKLTAKERRELIEIMKTEGPKLPPLIRISAYIDYNDLSDSEKAQYEDMVNKILEANNYTLIGNRNYFQIMAILREKKRKLILEDKFAKTESIDKAMQKISQVFTERKLYKSKAELVRAIEFQVKIVYEGLQNEKQKYIESKKLLLEEIEKSMDMLKARCDQQIDDFDASIPTVLPPQYCKLTPKTLNLRKMEQSLISSKRYKEAEKYHKEFEQAKKKDLEDKKLEYYKSFENQRKSLEIKNNLLISSAESKWKTRLIEFEQAESQTINNKIIAYNNLINKLETAKSEYVGEEDYFIEN